MYNARLNYLLKSYGIEIIDMEKLNDNLDLAVKAILTESCAGKRCALWGAGRMNTTSSHAAVLIGKYATYLKKLVCIIDSDKSLQGKTFLGFPIIAPEDIHKFDLDIIVISSKNSGASIIKSLHAVSPNSKYVDIYEELRKRGLEVYNNFFDERSIYTQLYDLKIQLKNSFDRKDILKKMISLYLGIRDFYYGFYYIDLYINEKYEEWEKYRNLKRDILILLKEIKDINSKKTEDVSLFYIDALRAVDVYDACSQKPKVLKEYITHGQVYTNMYSTGTTTYESMVSAILGKYPLDCDVYTNNFLRKFEENELLKYVYENGYKINATALENLKQKLIDNEITTLNSQANSTRATIEQTAKRIGAYNLEIEAISNLQTAQREAGKLRLGQSDVGIGSLTYEQYKATMAASGLELDYKSADEFEKAKAEQQKLYKQIIDYGELLERNEKLIEMLNSGTFGVGKSTFNDINKNKDKEANKALDNYIKRLNFKKNMDELSIEDEIAGYQYAYDYLAKTEDEKMDLMVKIHNAQKKLQEDLFNNQLKLINRKVKLGEWSTEQEINELRWTLQAFAFTAEQKEQIIERIYDKEKQLQKERLDNSKKWIEEQKDFDLLTIEEEIAAWERVKVNQIDNIEAVKEAEKNLHQLRKKQNEEFINLTEKTYEHWAKVGVYTIEQQIEKLKELHKFKQYDAYEEMKYIETLQDLYKELIEERLDGIKKAAETSIEAIEDEYEARIKAENDLIDKLDKKQKALKRLREDEDYEKKRKELLEKRRYHELRTGEEHTKAIIDIDKELAELEEKINRTKEDRKIEDERDAAQDRIDNLENERDEKIKIINKELKKIEELFDENKILIAVAEVRNSLTAVTQESEKNIYLKESIKNAEFNVKISKER